VSPNTRKVDIALLYGDLTPIISWCERNCTGEWGWNQLEPAGAGAGVYEFFFDEERDAVAFTLWKT
jgi:hypothetical protein